MPVNRKRFVVGGGRRHMWPYNASRINVHTDIVNVDESVVVVGFVEAGAPVFT